MDDTIIRYTPRSKYKIRTMSGEDHDDLVARILADDDLMSDLPNHVRRDLNDNRRIARNFALSEIVEHENSLGDRVVAERWLRGRTLKDMGLAPAVARPARRRPRKPGSAARRGRNRAVPTSTTEGATSKKKLSKAERKARAAGK
jgi:hypothetical protein